MAWGITAVQEAAAEAAIQRREMWASGLLTLVQLQHGRTATITDRLQPELGGPGYANLLVFSPKEVNFYGSGRLVRTLAQAFPGGWYGGALPGYGFWGHGAPLPSRAVLLERLQRELPDGEPHRTQ